MVIRVGVCKGPIPVLGVLGVLLGALAIAVVGVVIITPGLSLLGVGVGGGIACSPLACSDVNEDGKRNPLPLTPPLPVVLGVKMTLGLGSVCT